jgi:branched-chain amino acid transport system permease protein
MLKQEKRKQLLASKPNRKLIIDVVIIAVVLIALSPVLSFYRMSQFMIFCILAMSLDLLYGFMGYLSFGHVLYLGTGIYASALFSIYVSGNPILCIIIGVASGALLAAILGSFLINLRDAAFALTNLAFNQVGFFLIGSTFQKVTKGDDGIAANVEPWGKLNFSNEFVAFVFILLCVLLVFYFLKRLTSSPFGIMIKSIKENETRVKFLGYNTFYYKWLTFIITGGIAAFAGTLYTCYIQFVSPTFMHPLTNVEAVFAVLIGGAGNIYGALIGGFIYMLMRDWLSTIINQWEWILGIILLVVVFWLRGGLVGLATKILKNYKERKASK